MTHLKNFFLQLYNLLFFNHEFTVVFKPASRIKMVSDSQIGETCQRNYCLNILARIVSTLEGPISAPFKINVSCHSGD